MDLAKLEYEMRRKRINKTEMCVMLGISKTAFYRKCYGKSEFTQREIQKVMEILNLESPVEIFFAKEVS